MNGESDQELLTRYSRSGEEPAFAEIVRHQVDWVYSAACRIVVDPHLAEDVTQTVFTSLARESSTVVRKLQQGVPLSAWLHRTTRNVAAKTVRTEERRRARENEYVMDPDTAIPAASEEPAWAQIAPHLDAAIAELPDADRDALLLRYFDRRTAREIASRLGIGEEAAQKRVSRAMERLRGLLEARGIPVSVVSLSAAVTSQAVQPAPAGLATAIGMTAVASAPAGPAAWISSWFTAKSIAVGTTALAAGLAVTAVWQQREHRRLLDEIRSLPPVQALPAPLPPSPPADDELHAEVLRLRGEVARLLREQEDLRRAATARVTALQAPAAPATESPESQEVLAAQQQGIRKMNFVKQWVLACILYAGDHEERMPESFADASKYAGEPDESGDLQPEQFELIHSGPLSAISNPAQTILIREREPFAAFINRPGFMRTYGFVDGHTEIHYQADGNFEAFEAARGAVIRPPTGGAGSQ